MNKLLFLSGALLFFVAANAQDEDFLKIGGNVSREEKKFFHDDTLRTSSTFRYWANDRYFLFQAGDILVQNIFPEEAGFADSSSAIKDKIVPYFLQVSKSDFDEVFFRDTVVVRKTNDDKFIDSARIVIDSEPRSHISYTSVMYYQGAVQYRKILHKVLAQDTAGIAEVRETISNYEPKERDVKKRRKSAKENTKPTIPDSVGSCLAEHFESADTSLLIYSFRGCLACSWLVKDLMSQSGMESKIILINTIDSEADIEAYLEKMKLDLPVISPDCYSFKAAPTSLLIANGEILKSWIGYSSQTVEEISEALAE